MSDLNLPPRRPMPPDVRDRVRGRVFAGHGLARTGARAPLAVAAGVIVLAASAAIVAQSVAGTPDDFRPGTTTSTTTSTTAQPPPPVRFRPLPAAPPDAHTTDDLDRCGAVAAASPRAAEFAPRSAWQPVYTVNRRGHRITAFREYGGKPGFCDVTATTATVSDPSAEPMSLGIGGSEPINVEALYLSGGGLLGGIAQGVHELGAAVGDEFSKPVLRNEVFVVDVGELADGDVLHVGAFDGDGNVIADGQMTFDHEKVRPVGATATDR
jgi:hypothetical protein